METTSSISMANKDEEKLHIVMFPWLAFGHMIPFLELSKLMAKGHKISFISTPLNIDRLPKPPPSLVHLIDFVKIPIPRVDNLPKDAESTSDLPYDNIKYLKIAYDKLIDPVSEFLHVSSPDWVFFDFAPYWVPEIASKLGISTAYFSISNVAALCFFGSVSVFNGYRLYRTKPEDFTVPPKWIPFETTVAFRLFEIRRIFYQSVSGDDKSVSDLYRVGVSVQGCDFVATKSCSEFEPEWLYLLQDLYKKKPLFPSAYSPPTQTAVATTTRGMKLKSGSTSNKKGSVLYVAFGSEAKLSQEELTEIALGLELSDIPFFWVLRKRAGSSDTELVEVPQGFEERTKGKGVVWTSWVPQPRLLRHDAVGGFLTHGGTGSVVDGIQFGKPLLVFTFLAETGISAKIWEEKKLEYSIPRDEFDGSVTREVVAESLRLVMIENVGKIYRTKAVEMSALFGDRARQDRYVANMLDHLISHAKK